jgi:hypothetical protein
VPVIPAFLFAGGGVSTVAATVAYSIAAFLVWLAIVSAGCPAGGYECPF